jgi:hypothetical protein
MTLKKPPRITYSVMYSVPPTWPTTCTSLLWFSFLSYTVYNVQQLLYIVQYLQNEKLFSAGDSSLLDLWHFSFCFMHEWVTLTTAIYRICVILSERDMTVLCMTPRPTSANYIYGCLLWTWACDGLCTACDCPPVSATSCFTEGHTPPYLLLN